MNQVIVKPNTKGQLVIPVSMRKNWGISDKTYLHVVDTPNVGIVIKPLEPKKKSLYQILKSTQGAWAGDNWPKEEKEIEERERKAAEEMRKAW